MKKFGLIGGTSWHSTVAYYSEINQRVNDYYGNNTNPPLRLLNLDQKQLHDMQRADQWDAISAIYLEAVLELQKTGVEGIALCANTPHKIFAALDDTAACPVLHIADAIAATLKSRGIQKVGLLGTRFTMSEDFIKGRLLKRHRIKTTVPTDEDQQKMQQYIYDELVVGTFSKETELFCSDVVESLAEEGAEAVILGCTELPLLLKDTHHTIPKTYSHLPMSSGVAVALSIK